MHHEPMINEKEVRPLNLVEALQNGSEQVQNAADVNWLIVIILVLRLIEIKTLFTERCRFDSPNAQ